MNIHGRLIHRASAALYAFTTIAFILVVPAQAKVNSLPSRQVTPQAITPVVARLRGGVHYDPALPLEATVKPRFDERNPPSGSLPYDVTFKGGDGVTVPAIFVTPTGAKAAPCVVLMHGLGGDKTQMFLIASALAGKGYASISIDAAGHGARPKIGGKLPTDLDPVQLHQLAAQTIADLGRAVDFVDSRPEVDPQRVGFLGISLGGILGAVFISDDPRIHTAVLWAAGADWGKLIATSTLTAARPETRAAGAADQIEAVMADVDPLKTIHAFSPRPLLFINGDMDKVVPVACTKELTDAAGDPKKLIVLPGGHIPNGLTMMADSIVWFESHLKS